MEKNKFLLRIPIGLVTRDFSVSIVNLTKSGSIFNSFTYANKKPATDHQKPQQAHLRQKGKEGGVKFKKG